MTSLYARGFIGLAVLFAVMASLLFISAGTLHYWQAWLFLAVYFGASIAISLISSGGIRRCLNGG